MTVYKDKVHFTGKSRQRASKIEHGVADRKAKEKKDAKK